MIPPALVELFGSNVEIGTAAVAVVLTGVLVRVYVGSALFHPRHVKTWNVLRRVLAPMLQRLIYLKLPFNIEIENESHDAEYAATVEAPPAELATTIDDVREVEVPLLAGFKTAPDGRRERGTFVWHIGPRPFASAPRWLRRYQVHPTLFKRDDGRYDVYAHWEANSYRPDLWADHLFKGVSFSAGKGVRKMQNALDDADVEWRVDHPDAAVEGA